MMADVLGLEGYEGIEPIHPYGGPDGKRDIRCRLGSLKFVCACYFPTNSLAITFADLMAKFRTDLAGVKNDGAQGFIFGTNVHVTDGERAKLIAIAAKEGVQCQIYELDRLRHLLDKATACHLRQRWLGIAITPEDQIAFFAQVTVDYKREIGELKAYVMAGATTAVTAGSGALPTSTPRATLAVTPPPAAPRTKKRRARKKPKGKKP
jgi:hypothetical protein